MDIVDKIVNTVINMKEQRDTDEETVIELNKEENVIIKREFIAGTDIPITRAEKWHKKYYCGSESFFDHSSREEVVDRVVRLLGSQFFSLNRTASGARQLEEGDEIYDFWQWVMENDEFCMVCRNDAGEGQEDKLVMLVDYDIMNEFANSFLPDCECMVKAKMYNSGAAIDVMEILPYAKKEDVWKYRPAGLRDEW